MRFKLVFTFFFLLSLTACAPDSNKISTASFIDSILMLDDHENNLSITDITSAEQTANFKQQKQNNSFEIGRNSTTSWLKLKISNEIDPLKNYILEIDRPTLDEVGVFIPEKGIGWKAIQTGDNFKFSNREIQHANFLFAISGSIAKANQRGIYLRIKNKVISSASINPLGRKCTFHEHDKAQNLFKGLYFGALLALIIFNLFIFTSVRDISYLWYAAYLGFITLFLLAYSGLSFQYLWPEQPSFADKSTFISILLSLTSRDYFFVEACLILKR